jgi:hypothetical protein
VFAAQIGGASYLVLLLQRVSTPGICRRDGVRKDTTPGVIR